MSNGKRRMAKLYCELVEPENAECGKGLKNVGEYSLFVREMERKYLEKYVGDIEVSK